MILDPSDRRHRLIDAVGDAVVELIARGHADDMVGICAGGLVFQLSGEEGEPCSDEDIQTWMNNPAALEFALFADLREAWQGFVTDEEESAARDIVSTIARHFSERATLDSFIRDSGRGR